MADAGILWTQDQFSCPICLDVLNDPATIPCGHSFCIDCITGCWNHEDQQKNYSCPQCRHTCISRPVLSRNTMLAEVVEKLKTVGLQPALPAHCYAGSGDVECDVCTGKKRKAVKSCLVCLASYCDSHLKLHDSLNPEKKHKLMDAAGKLQDLICSRHDKLLEVFCSTDQKCICLLCAMDEHSGHKTVSVVAERNEKQKQLVDTQMDSHRRIQEREEDLKKLDEIIKSLKHSAQTAVRHSEQIFVEMIHAIGRRRSEVIQLIRDQERAEVSRAEELMEKLEQEIIQMKKRDAELQRLLQTEDHTRFLQSFHSQCSFFGFDNSPIPTFHMEVSFEDLMKSVSKLKKKLVDELQHQTYSGSQKADVVKAIPSPEPKTRKDFLEYSCQFTLDPNTAQSQLHLSDGNREVTCRDGDHSYPDHPERFDYWHQVLCKKGVSQRCYWEVEWSGGGQWGVFVAVSYKGINRKGNSTECWFGYNDQSWSMQCCSLQYCFMHNCNKININPCDPRSSRIGVYVDHQAGILSFYKVYRNTMTLLHKVQTIFTQALYPGFWLYDGSKVKLCD